MRNDNLNSHEANCVNCQATKMENMFEPNKLNLNKRESNDSKSNNPESNKATDQDLNKINRTHSNDLTYLRSDWIHNHLLELSARERKLSAEIIEYLAEVDRRKIFAELGYASLFDYVTKGLLYTEGAATRRINAARLFRQIPEVKNKIVEGALTLGQLANVAAVIKKSENETNKKMTIQEKKVILEKLEFKSQRESEKELAETFNLQAVEFTKVVAKKNETFEVKFSLSKHEYDLIENTKNSLSHSVPSHDVKDLLIYFCEKFQKDLDKKRSKLKCEEALNKNSKEKEISELPTDKIDNELPKNGIKIKNNVSILSGSISDSNSGLNLELEVNQNFKSDLNEAIDNRKMSLDIVSKSKSSEHDKQPTIQKVDQHDSATNPINGKNHRMQSNNGAGVREQVSGKIKFQLKEQAGNQCEWRHPSTGDRCLCKSFLELDHSDPRAWGGGNELDNLRVLCREHNLYEALTRNLL